jgi:cysteine-rich repeat protein
MERFMIKASRLSMAWLAPAALLGLFLVLGQACGGEDSVGGASCIPGAQTNCGCPNNTMGIQVCGADGLSFGVCSCGNGAGGGGGAPPLNCGDAVVNDEEGEECDDGNDVNNDGCTNACTTPRCGDAIHQAGEDCDDGVDNGEFDNCPDDCKIGGQGGSGGTDCTGQITYAGMTAPEPSVWTDGGDIGIGAGTSLCQQIGADHFCDYEEVLAALALGELDADPNITDVGITAWVHRTTPAMVNGVLSEPGPGGRCNNWTYGTKHLADGEYVTLTKVAGAVTADFRLDNDAIYDGTANHSQPATELNCGANAGGPMRAILCCYPQCIP